LNSDSGADPTARHARQPRGFWRLALLQYWDNFALYGSRILLTLYVIDLLGHPRLAQSVWGLAGLRRIAAPIGAHGDQVFASLLFGLFGSLVALTPVLGGWIADRGFGRRRAVIAGAGLMAAGHALLALQRPFLFGLLLLVCGNGLFKSSITAAVAALYRPSDGARRSAGFQLVYVAVNLGVLSAPLVCGTIGEKIGWSYGFAAAAAGMAIGLLIYATGPRLDEATPTAEAARDAPAPAARATRLLIILGVALVFSGNEQIGNAVIVWIKQDVARGMGAVTLPATPFVAVVPLVCVIGAPLLIRIWAMRGKEDLFARMVAGAGIGAAAYALLAAVAAIDAGRPALAAWPVLMLALWAIAYLHVWPTGLTLMAILAPRGAQALWMALYFLAVVLADLITGTIGGLLSALGPPLFFLIQAGVIGIGAIVLAIAARRASGRVAR